MEGEREEGVLWQDEVGAVKARGQRMGGFGRK